jgi:hypothetical protein
LPFVIAYGFICAIYELTIGQIVNLVKQKNKYKDLTKIQNQTIEELRKQVATDTQGENPTE